jgi:galactose mutarotase-like enzyme
MTEYQTYVLSEPTAPARLEIVPERGGMVTRWQVNDQEILYLDAARFADPTLSVRGGIPILFPICGNLPDDTYTLGDQTFQLKQHGFARNLPWQVSDQTPTSLTLVLNSNQETLAHYPFEFQLVFTYQLVGSTLEIHQRLFNHSQDTMPCSLGLHPYFCCQDKSSLAFDIPANQTWNQLTQEVSSFTGSFDLEQDEIDLALRPLSRQSATVQDRNRNLAITLTYDSFYSTLVFWTIKERDFYCLEPWSAPRNAINTGESLTHLAPGVSMAASVTFLVSHQNNPLEKVDPHEAADTS